MNTGRRLFALRVAQRWDPRSTTRSGKAVAADGAGRSGTRGFAANDRQAAKAGFVVRRSGSGHSDPTGTRGGRPHGPPDAHRSRHRSADLRTFVETLRSPKERLNLRQCAGRARFPRRRRRYGFQNGDTPATDDRTKPEGGYPAAGRERLTTARRVHRCGSRNPSPGGPFERQRHLGRGGRSLGAHRPTHRAPFRSSAVRPGRAHGGGTVEPDPGAPGRRHRRRRPGQHPERGLPGTRDASRTAGGRASAWAGAAQSADRRGRRRLMPLAPLDAFGRARSPCRRSRCIRTAPANRDHRSPGTATGTGRFPMSP